MFFFYHHHHLYAFNEKIFNLQTFKLFQFYFCSIVQKCKVNLQSLILRKVFSLTFSAQILDFKLLRAMWYVYNARLRSHLIDCIIFVVSIKLSVFIMQSGHVFLDFFIEFLTISSDIQMNIGIWAYTLQYATIIFTHPSPLREQIHSLFEFFVGVKIGKSRMCRK